MWLCGYVVVSTEVLIGAEKILHLSQRSRETASLTLAGYILAIARSGQDAEREQRDEWKETLSQCEVCQCL
jgi:hypothetical protein